MDDHRIVTARWRGTESGLQADSSPFVTFVDRTFSYLAPTQGNRSTVSTCSNGWVTSWRTSPTTRRTFLAPSMACGKPSVAMTVLLTPRSRPRIRLTVPRRRLKTVAGSGEISALGVLRYACLGGVAPQRASIPGPRGLENCEVRRVDTQVSGDAGQSVWQVGLAHRCETCVLK